MQFLDKVLEFFDKLTDWATYGFKIISAITKGIKVTRDSWPRWPNDSNVGVQKEQAKERDSEGVKEVRSAGADDKVLDSSVSI